MIEKNSNKLSRISANCDLLLTREKEEIQIALGMIQSSFEDILAFSTELHPQEQTFYQSLKSDKRKHSYLLGRFSAKQAIYKLTDNKSALKVFIDRGVFNYPVLRGEAFANTQLSISHSEHIGFSVAFPETHPLGIDLEKIDHKRSETIANQLTETEVSLLNDHDYASIVYSVFGMKECLSKILKTGMMIDFKLLELSQIEFGESGISCQFLNFPQYKAISYRRNDFVFSLALPKKTRIDLDDFNRKIDTMMYQCHVA